MLCLVEYKLGSWERPPVLSTITKSSHRFLPIIQSKVNKVLHIVTVRWAELVENEVKVRDWAEVDSEFLSVRADGLLLKALEYVACRSGDSAEMFIWLSCLMEEGILAARPGSPESLQQLVEVAKTPAANLATLFAIFVGKDNTRQATEHKVSVLFLEWYRICELSSANVAACAPYELSASRGI
ncbi:unnamed protein product [Camellia sinensis]